MSQNETKETTAAGRPEESDHEPPQKYDYGSDEELPEHAKVHVSWRMSATTSMSDWTIEIISQKSSTAATTKDDESVPLSNEPPTKQQSVTTLYHVHKSYLAAGHKKSEYFCRLFRHEFAEACSCTSRIRLDDASQAAVFPQLLDYLYSPHDQLDATTETVMSLYELGQYFEMTSLRRQARKFWQRDLSAKTFGAYYEAAELHRCDKLKESLIMFMVGADRTYPNGAVLLNIPTKDILRTDVAFWLRVLNDAKDQRDNDVGWSRSHLSIPISVFCRHKYMNQATFLKLTTKEFLPTIHVEAVAGMMEAMRRILKPGKSDDKIDLHERCLRSWAANWEQLEPNQRRMTVGNLSECSSPVLSELVLALLEASKERVSSLDTTTYSHADY